MIEEELEEELEALEERYGVGSAARIGAVEPLPRSARAGRVVEHGDPLLFERPGARIERAGRMLDEEEVE